MALTYVLIASSVLSTTATDITFSSIPQTYTDLVLRTSTRVNGGSSTENYQIKINNDSTSSIYTSTYLESNGSTASSARSTNGINFAFPNVTTSGGSTASTFASGEFYLPNYTSTVAKQASSITTPENNDPTNKMYVLAQRLNLTSAINRIDIIIATGSSFVSGSSFYLYGIKNS